MPFILVTLSAQGHFYRFKYPLSVNIRLSVSTHLFAALLLADAGFRPGLWMEELVYFFLFRGKIFNTNGLYSLVHSLLYFEYLLYGSFSFTELSFQFYISVILNETLLFM